MTIFLCCKNRINTMKHELVKKNQLLLSLQNSTRRELRIKFLSHRFVVTQDFASKAQDQK